MCLHTGLGRGSCRHVRDTQRETSPRIATHRHVSPRSALSPFSARVSAPRTARQIATHRLPSPRIATHRQPSPRMGEHQPTHARGARPGLPTHWPRARKFAHFCDVFF